MLALHNLPPLLSLGNVADFNTCKFIFLRLYLPDDPLSRHCQLLICVLKASVRVLSVFFLNIFVIKLTGRTDPTHYIHVCHLGQMPNHPKQIEDLCIDSKYRSCDKYPEPQRSSWRLYNRNNLFLGYPVHPPKKSVRCRKATHIGINQLVKKP